MSESKGGQQSLRELAGQGADVVGEEGELTDRGTRGSHRRARADRPTQTDASNPSQGAGPTAGCGSEGGVTG